jgi:starvation-inducible DNA-binding protein
MNEFTLLSRIVEHPNKYPVKKAMLSELLSDNETIIYELRKDIDICTKETHDVGTANLLTSFLQQHESMAWILRKYLN